MAKSLGEKTGLLGWRKRRFSLSRCSNKARTYLLCSVRDADGKRFSLVVREGRGFDKWVVSAYREVPSSGLGC